MLFSSGYSDRLGLHRSNIILFLGGREARVSLGPAPLVVYHLLGLLDGSWIGCELEPRDVLAPANHPTPVAAIVPWRRLVLGVVEPDLRRVVGRAPPLLVLGVVVV